MNSNYGIFVALFDVAVIALPLLIVAEVLRRHRKGRNRSISTPVLGLVGLFAVILIWLLLHG